MGRKFALLALVSLALTGCAGGGSGTAGDADEDGTGAKPSPSTVEPAPDVVGEWLLTDGTDAAGSLRNVGTPVTLVLAGDSTVAGMAPCNSYGGEYVLTDTGFSFASITRSEVACSATAVETRYFAALERVAQADRRGDVLTLVGADVTLRFTLLAMLSVD